MRIVQCNLLIFIFLFLFFNTAHSLQIASFGTWTLSSTEVIPISDYCTTCTISATSSEGFIQFTVDNTDPNAYIQTIVSDPNANTIGGTTNTIGGTITDATTTSPVANVNVLIYSTTGSLITIAKSNEQGQYRTSELEPGEYYAQTESSDQYISQIYRSSLLQYGRPYIVNTVPPSVDEKLNKLCLPDCDITSGTIINVTDGFSSNGVDFALEEGGIITGLVTDEQTGEPLNNIQIDMFNDTGKNVLSFVRTGSDGRFVTEPESPFTVLPSGNYYIRTAYNENGYLDEPYHRLECLGCDHTSYIPVEIKHNTVTTDINFQLRKGGRISGVVVDGDTRDPLVNVNLDILDENGYWAASGWTDSEGHYFTREGLAPGVYFIFARPGNGYIDQHYNGEPCLTECDYLNDTPVYIVDNEEVTNINFFVNKGGQISGKVTGADEGPIPGASVDIYDADGSFITSGYPNENGNYMTHKGLLTGTYYARTKNSDGYINERYGDQPCRTIGCNPADGASINVTVGQVTSDINFSLALGGRISGEIIDTQTGERMSSYSDINIYDENGVLIERTYSSLGHYITRAGLLPGSYYAHTVNYGGYINESYQEKELAGEGNITDATPIVISSIEIVSDINFTLEKGSKITGTIYDALTNEPLTGVYPRVQIFDLDGDMVSYAYVDNSGIYDSDASLPPGDYYIRVFDPQGNYASQLYGKTETGHACKEWQRCDISSGQAVTVYEAGDTENINFYLSLLMKPKFENLLQSDMAANVDNSNDSGMGSFSIQWLACLIMVVSLCAGRNRQDLIRSKYFWTNNYRK